MEFENANDEISSENLHGSPEEVVRFMFFGLCFVFLLMLLRVSNCSEMLPNEGLSEGLLAQQLARSTRSGSDSEICASINGGLHPPRITCFIKKAD